MGVTYDADVIAWAREQAALLRAGEFSRLDVAHLLKWLLQPERRGASWTVTIQVHRRAVERRLAKTPSLRAETARTQWLQDV